jgi:hypothetical protein
VFVTEMRHELAQRLLLNPSPSMNNALSLGLSGLPPNARIGVIPYANATIPVLTTDRGN